MPENTFDFRAPPPSPVASGRRSSVTNDEVLTEFLESSLRIPDLVLPDKIFPKQKILETPPKVDFVSLCLHHDEDQIDAVSDAVVRIGCFQLVNHGIPKEMVASAADAAAGVFDVPSAERYAAVRSSEKPWGFEEYHGGEEGESEEFVWCRENELKLKMEGIWPNGYPNFSKKMETLMSRIETVAEKILPVILKNIPRNFEDDDDYGDDMGHHHHQAYDLGTLCCVYKHHHHQENNTLDHGWASSLKYEVIRMLIRGTDYSHSLCLYFCDGSSEFHLYSKKNWLSFSPEQGAIIITIGDKTQVLSDGKYKHVIGRPMFRERGDRISMAFLYSTHLNTKKSLIKTDRGRTISLAQQAIFAIILTLVYHFLIFVNNIF